MENNKKYYLNDIMEGHFFDTSDLNEEAWQLDEDGGWYTTLKAEKEWFERLAVAYDRIDEYDIDTTAANDYDDVIAMAMNYEPEEENE